MPVLFVGHGSPMNVIEDNRWSRGFAILAGLVPRPTAVLAVSAHWYVNGTLLTADAHPKTIHDFHGFPRALYEIEYRAPGKVDLAARVRRLLGTERSSLSTDWGLDHGTWSVLRWMFPDAGVPVVQLSIDRRLEPKQHVELARSLAELRHEGVLILGSGNIVHNLADAIGRMGTGRTDTPAWASRFDGAVAAAVAQHDTGGLVDLWPGTDDGRVAHPTPDHFLPLIYAAAVVDDRDGVRFSSEGFDLGSISMRNIIWS
jgi:4,5-DOPA dioxygenase extradiol